MSEILLNNAPLKEVIFELHWGLDFIPEQNVFIDIGFEEALFAFQNNCEFKIVQTLNKSNEKAQINVVSHRFFKEKGTYPVYQLGPGVFTVNDNDKNYSWKNFKEMILEGIKCLRCSYNKDIFIEKIELRYIDAVETNVLGHSDKFEFIRQAMNVPINDFTFLENELLDFNFSNRYILDDTSYLNLLVASGVNNETNNDVVIWHTFINNNQVISWEGLNNWIENAHNHASAIFKKMIKPELYDLFT
jgi:uncharacterized protein (TIGR04255 family)